LSNSEYISVGVIVKPHGLKGDVVVKVEVNYALQMREFDTHYVNHGGSYVPYVVESFASLNKGLVKLKFTGLDSQESAAALRGIELFQPAEVLAIDKQIDLTGYLVIDKSSGSIGKVVSVIEKTAQTLLEIERDGVEMYVPFVDDFLIQIDSEKSEILMDLPEGMLDL
jgi:16S rRNA processing protein RimM